jgi:uncharacterized membrane protein YhaH (DUF805 family)
VNFFEAIKICFSKYVDFTGRAPRSEYWWFVLFVFVLAVVFTVVDPERAFIFHLGVLLPQLAVSVRRLHDVNRSGWWLLILFVPLVGYIVLLVWFCQKGEAVANLYGPPPLADGALAAET